MSRPRAHALIAVVRSLAFVALTAMAAACSGKDADSPDSRSQAGRRLTPYVGRSADLFDDTIEPAAVGLDFDKGYAPRVDKTLRERAQVGDAVVRVRVATVTTKKDGPDSNYQLGLHTVEKLMGKSAPPEDFTVHIGKASESHGIMQNFESRLVGYPFVAFVREFSTPGGEREVHFHLAPDTKEVKMAVSDAQLLSETK